MMKVLIIEDEQPASERLIRLLKESGADIEVTAVLKSVSESIGWLSAHPSPELIFMDIQLEDGIGFEIFEKGKIHSPVIFTTAYDEYALQAFKVNSVDYLLKPIAAEELQNAIRKFHTFHQTDTNYAQIETLLKRLQPVTKERFLVKIGRHYQPVAVSRILCFYIRERSTFLRTDSGKNYAIDYSLDKIERLLDPQQFFRVNRNFIVRYSAIRDIVAYSSNRLKITLLTPPDTEEILVSRERTGEFKNWMDR